MSGTWEWGRGVVAASGTFIDSVCDPSSVRKDFHGELGRFTPCFTDIVILGSAHVLSVVLCCVRLWVVLRSSGCRRYHLRGWARTWQASVVAATAAALAVVLSHLNARIAAHTAPYSKAGIAPYEWLGYGLSALSWASLLSVFVSHLHHYSPQSTWLWRFPLMLIFAGELSKLRFVLQLAEGWGYFIWLYITYVVLQAYLVVFAAAFHPPKSLLNPRDDGNGEVRGDGYSVLDGGPAPTGPRHSSSTSCEAYPSASSPPPPAAPASPEARAGLLSRLVFAWVGPTLRVGYSRGLEQEDAWPLAPGDSSAELASGFWAQWQKQRDKALEGKAPSLAGALWGVVGGLVLSAVPFKLVNDASQFVGPYFLHRMLRVAAGEGEGSSMRDGYLYALAMCLGLMTGSLADAQHFQRLMRAGNRARSCLVHCVFCKALRLSPSARAEFGSGRVFNLVTTDAEQVQLLSQWALAVISSPLRISVALVSLYSLLGPSSLMALAILGAAIPVQALMVRKSSQLLRSALRHTDERCRVEKELVGAVEVVKCSCWQDAFRERIHSARRQELAVLWRSFVVAAVNTFLLNVIPTLVTLATFSVYVLLGNELTAAKAFTSFTLFDVLRGPLFQLPMVVSLIVNTRVSFGRLQEFLQADESHQQPLLPPAPPGEVALRVSGDFSWGGAAAEPALKAIDLQVQAGQLVAVVGPTGSGKSSLLCAALGLLEQPHGSTPPRLKGAAAYVPQAAFLFNGTVRDNVTFGLEWDEARYEAAVRAAALGPDLEALPGGDLTELGDQGINISGGQRQRVAIARAVYSGADVYLFDDPLSALDAKVGRQVFNTCIRGELKGKACVLVTNQLQYVRSADLVVCMSGGAMSEVGTYQELMDTAGEFAKMMEKTEVDEQQAGEYDLQDVVDDSVGGEAPPSAVPAAAKPTAGGGIAAAGDDAGAGGARTAPTTTTTSAAALAAGAGGGVAQRRSSAGDGGGGQEYEADVMEKGALTQQESRSKGAVSWSVIGTYVQALGGGPRFLVLALTFIMPELMRASSSVWLARWTSSGQDGSSGSGRNNHYNGTAVGIGIGGTGIATAGADGHADSMVASEPLPSIFASELLPSARAAPALLRALSEVLPPFLSDAIGRHSTMWWLGIYAVLCAGQVACALANALTVKLLSVRASSTLHNQMLDSVLSAPMSFFHTTPVGRLVNRFTKDTSDVDRNLADFTSIFVRAVLQLGSVVLLVGCATPFTLSLLAPILLVFYFLFVYFQSSVREAKRLDAVTRSPVYGSLSEALAGLSTISAFRAQRRVEQRNRQLLDTNAAFAYMNMGLNRWLGVRLESLGALAALSVAALALQQRGGAAVLGLTVSYALQITILTSMTVRLASIAESSFNAVERVAEYSDLPKEPPYVIPGSVPPEWPQQGKVEFREVTMRYRPGLPLVLRGLNVTIGGGERVGIVGRTGAGKSTILNCLFRLTEASSGQVVIDGVDVRHVGLNQLRGRLALIPQAPVLFAGSLRENLSLFDDHGDDALWEVVGRAHLAPVVRALPGGLDAVLGEGGSPLSAGQRQLLVLARALLRRAKVLVLDEATANIDIETDALVQRTIRQELGGTTLISIAHRLHTVIDFDKVLVMAGGRAAEYAPPAELLDKPDGILNSMVRETGPATERFLRSMARGDDDAQQALSSRASAGLERVQQPCCLQMEQAAAALLGRAEAARGLLRQLLRTVREHDRARLAAESMDLQLDPTTTGDSSGGGGSGGRVVAGLMSGELRLQVADAMQQASEAVEEVERLAELAALRLHMCGAGGGGVAAAAAAMGDSAGIRDGGTAAFNRSYSLPPIGALGDSGSSTPQLRSSSFNFGRSDSRRRSMGARDLLRPLLLRVAERDDSQPALPSRMSREDPCLGAACSDRI